MLRDRSACTRTSGKSGRSGAQRHEVAGAANEPATRSAYYCSDARPVPRRCGTTQNLSKAGSRRRNLATSLHKELWNSERLGFAKMKHAPKPYVEVPFGECQSTIGECQSAIRGMPKCHSGNAKVPFGGAGGIKVLLASAAPATPVPKPECQVPFGERRAAAFVVRRVRYAITSM